MLYNTFSFQKTAYILIFGIGWSAGTMSQAYRRDGRTGLLGGISCSVRQVLWYAIWCDTREYCGINLWNHTFQGRSEWDTGLDLTGKQYSLV